MLANLQQDMPWNKLSKHSSSLIGERIGKFLDLLPIWKKFSIRFDPVPKIMSIRIGWFVWKNKGRKKYKPIFLMASTIQQIKFFMDNDRIKDNDEIYEAIQILWKN